MWGIKKFVVAGSPVYITTGIETLGCNVVAELIESFGETIIDSCSCSSNVLVTFPTFTKDYIFI